MTAAFVAGLIVGVLLAGLGLFAGWSFALAARMRRAQREDGE